jgi:hypothetical protein
MNYKFVYLTILFFSVSLINNVFGQKAEITFIAKTFDFGDINEADGKVTNVFNFTNSGTAPLVIQRVNASCGCTTPEWTKAPIEAGKQGSITVTYNPLGRPGRFSKEVYIYSNATNETERLVIKGNVIPKPTVNTPQYSFQMENLALVGKSIHVGNINKGSLQMRTINIKNTSNSPLKIATSNTPSYIECSVKPSTLQPNEEGVISIVIDSKKSSEWGPFSENIFLFFNGKKVVNDDNKIVIAGNVVEDFTKLSSSDKREAPILEIKSSNLFFGNIKKGNKVRGKIDIKNVGKNPLEIRRIINNNSELNIHPMRATIKSGKSETIHIDVNSNILSVGNYKKSFSVVTNDPTNTVIVYTIDFNVN